MSQSGASDYSGAILGVLLAMWFFRDESTKPLTVRVTEVLCDQSWSNTGTCPGKLSAGSDLYFELNSSSRAASMTVKRKADASPWYVNTLIFKDCAIVDESNWECGEKASADSGEPIGMRDGAYYRGFPPPYGLSVRGIVGWRYWLNKIYGPNSSYVGSG